MKWRKPRPEPGLDCLMSGLDCLICGLDCLICALDCLTSALDCLIFGIDCLISGLDWGLGVQFREVEVVAGVVVRAMAQAKSIRG